MTHIQSLWVAAIIFLFWSDYNFLNLNWYQTYYMEDMVRVHLKEYENLKNLIIVHAKQNLISILYYNIETAMSYVIYKQCQLEIWQSFKEKS